jgi:molybdopterin molybdotransferase
LKSPEIATYPTMKSLTEIADALQGYDPNALRADAALQFLAELVQPVRESTRVDIKSALGRVLATDVVSPIDVPAHDNSAMDGYAFSGAQLHDGELVLSPVGTAFAGKAWNGVVGMGQCVKIMTGAIMPAGLDTVVPQEMVQVRGDTITISAGTLRPGDNRRFRGEDLQKDKPALTAGKRLGPADLGLLASLGIGEVVVWRRPAVAYFSTGDEILSLGEAPREGAVFDSNRYTLFGLLFRLGVEVIDMGVVKDDPAALQDAFTDASRQADAIITSGGVSVGEADHTKAVMRNMSGGETGVAFWKIAMRPGRPMAVGRIGKAVLFGLPGNPVAVMVTFLAFVRPALLQMMGCDAAPLPLLQARSAEAIRKKPGRSEYQRATVTTAPDGTLQVKTTGQQGSGVLSSMAQANGLIVLGHHQGNVAAGETVEVMMFEGCI